VRELVVDTSALVAVALEETGSGRVVTHLFEAERSYFSAPSVLELGMVLEGRTPQAIDIANRLMRDLSVHVVPFDEKLAGRAMGAFRRFGKGRHPAGLNFGDCCTYALAEERGLPLLCVGEDFARTDLVVLP
jgi:ribonuclease VapC